MRTKTKTTILQPEDLDWLRTEIELHDFYYGYLWEGEVINGDRIIELGLVGTTRQRADAQKISLMLEERIERLVYPTILQSPITFERMQMAEYQNIW